MELLEKSYMCAEQIGQMQGSYDAFVLVKITHDAGVDVVNDPIDFYCYDFSGNSHVFLVCMKRIFEGVEQTFEGYDENGMSQNSYRVPLPELKQFYPLLRDDERDQYVRMFNAMLSISDEYFCEFGMDGMMAGNCFHITITGEYGFYSSLLKQMVAIRNEVRELIRIRREQLVNGLRSVVLTKMVYDRLGVVANVSLEDHSNVVFSRIMEKYSNLSISLDAGDPFSFETMKTMLDGALEQAVIKNDRKDVAA